MLYQAISSGALLQMRVFGGALGLAIASSVMNNHLTTTITNASVLDQVLSSIENIRNLDPPTQESVIAAFGGGYKLQFQIMVGFGIAQVVAVALLYRRSPIRIVEEHNQKSGQKERQMAVEEEIIIEKDVKMSKQAS